MTAPSDVRRNDAEQCYELTVDGETAIAAWDRTGDVIDFVHTAVPRALAGRGVGTRLVDGAVADVRARGLKMRASCSFVAAWVARHPEAGDLLAG